MKETTPLQEIVPVGIGPRQSAHLEAKNDSDVVEVHLGQEPLEAPSALGGGPGLSLIVGDDDHPVGWPAPDDGAVPKAGLDFSRLFIEHDLIGAGLADVDDGQPLEVPGLDLGGWRWRAARHGVRTRQPSGLIRGEEGVRGAHDPPPARRRLGAFAAGLVEVPGSSAGDSAGADWTKEGPVAPAVSRSPLVGWGGVSDVGLTL